MYTMPELSAKRINPGNMCFKPRLFFSIYYKTKDDAFKAAAGTWKRDVGHNEAFVAGYDTFVEVEIASEGDFKRAWSEIYRLSVNQKLLVWCGHVLTHASKQTDQNDGLEMNQMLEMTARYSSLRSVVLKCCRGRPTGIYYWRGAILA